MVLPNEILTLIFQHFNSRRYLINVSLVCQQWNLVTADPIFYKHITIYTYIQLAKFVKAAIENLKHHHKPMGHYVQQLVILCDEYIEDNILKQLETCCPYLTLLQLLRNRDLNSYERYTSFGKITKVQLIESDMLIHYLDDDAKEKEKEDKNTIVLHKISDQFQFYTYSQQSLTELCLQCYPRIYDTWLDYSFFDSIHQSFPQLIKLTIANVHWPNVEDDTWTNYKKPPNSLTSLTTLCLDNINMAPPTIFNHITDSYPNLETLEIKHLVFFDETLDPGVRRVYENICGQGIFHMFTTLAISHLKHFILEEFEPTEFWPTRELLEWMDRNHQAIQLKTLSWPYGILPAEYDLNESCGIHFLQQLDTLSFHLLDTTLVNLKSMFNNKTISYNLSSLSLTPYEYTEQKLRLDLFDWLDVFPNLIILVVHKWKVYVNTDSNNNNNNSNNNDDDHHHQQQKQHYPLQKLVLRDCDLQIEDTLTIICQHCPKLKILHSIRNCIYNPIYNILTNDEGVEKEEDIYHSIICAPHLDIIELKIDNLRCFYYNGKKLYPDYADFVLNVSSSYPAFTIPKRSLLPPESPSTTTKIVHHITIKLNSIDRFYFNGRWALY